MSDDYDYFSVPVVIICCMLVFTYGSVVYVLSIIEHLYVQFLMAMRISSFIPVGQQECTCWGIWPLVCKVLEDACNVHSIATPCQTECFKR